MTLEQIKNRQNYINERLYSLLQNAQGVVASIIGEHPPVKDNTIEQKPRSSGFLGEISNLQDHTEGFIEELENYNRLLISNTYAPNETICVQEKR